MFAFGQCVLDPDRRELRRDGVPVSLEPQVFDLIEHLLRHREKVVTRDELLEHVWRGRVVADSTISVRINAARRAIGDSGQDQCLIRTMSRKGYRFAGPVREIDRAGVAAADVARNQQTLAFCRTRDSVNIAFAEVGDGAVVVRTATWLNHLEYEWQSPIRRPLLDALSAKFRLVRYDGRGNGLSDWSVPRISFDAFLDDLDAVIGATGLQRYALMGVSQGAAIAIAHAARYPERVTKLFLHGAYARGRARRPGTTEKETAEALLSIMRRGWGDEGSAYLRAFSSLYLPGATREQIGWLADLQRNATSAENAVRLRQACDEIDITDSLARVRAPTLVTHSRRDGVVPFEEGRSLAAAVPGARFFPLDSDNHILMSDEPAWPAFVHEFQSFLSAA